MQELYTESQSLEPLAKQEKPVGIPEKIVHLIGVFLFYILLFGAISLISHGFDFFREPETATRISVQSH